MSKTTKWLITSEDREDHNVTSIYFPYMYSCRSGSDGVHKRKSIDDPLTLYFFMDRDIDGLLLYQTTLKDIFNELYDESTYEKKELKKGVHIKLLTELRDALHQQIEDIDKKLDQWKSHDLSED